MKINISSRLGEFQIISSPDSDRSFETSTITTFNLKIWGLNLKDKSLEVVEKITEQITKDLDKFLVNEKQTVNNLINEKFLVDNNWLDRAYQYRFKEPFSIQDFKESFVLKELILHYSSLDFGNLMAYDFIFLPNEKFSFGFQVSSRDEMNGKNFVYFDTDFNYEACLNVLRQENEAKFSLEVLRFLSFMEGCIHQGTLYDSSAYVTEELIKCLNTAHQEVKFEIARLLYNLQQGYIDTLEHDMEAIKSQNQKEQAQEELKYAQEVKAVFENNYDELAKWKTEESVKEITEAILEKISE
ncbi:hypothetical protein Fleli_3402 [Bernardetia litoralis DSM 6794]|uniref:Uncharacterized protein n=1 Tax=Bernardetia litoralis (strain ATCC 23117 / DSM 6794 / NBRC 15988 / NCIMB 1366 / Fx l1 / Sio-4) TaxID=880071 RepID=I4AP39_BERLS|nr:hypothetical protein [Bernardetia litoralis]AFM05724.1 hypothetical protein Fleli_3402 [Bernardetia litoralis DSM 6794]